MRIAFFDFDRTLIRDDAGRLCALPTVYRGMVGPRLGLRLAGTYVLYRAGLCSRAHAMRHGLRCYRGKTLVELRELMQALYEDYVRHAVSPAMRARVGAHLERGDRVAILTASAFFFAEPVAADLGIHHVVGTRVRFDERGVCTGGVAGEVLGGAAKLARAAWIAGAYRVPLARCAFYTDHVSDLPLLDAVGEPVCVAPHRPLAKLARLRGWEIVGHDDHHGDSAPSRRRRAA